MPPIQIAFYVMKNRQTTIKYYRAYAIFYPSIRSSFQKKKTIVYWLWGNIPWKRNARNTNFICRNVIWPLYHSFQIYEYISSFEAITTIITTKMHQEQEKKTVSPNVALTSCPINACHRVEQHRNDELILQAEKTEIKKECMKKCIQCNFLVKIDIEWVRVRRKQKLYIYSHILWHLLSIYNI